jgi:sulfotransferase
MNKQFSFLSGLPRTGSTLLCSILAQNPNLHAEGYSHVCELMRRIYFASANTTLTNWHDDIIASEREKSIVTILRSIPYNYYVDVNKNIILDKCRAWTLPGNLALIEKYITNNPKTVVLIRPIEEIVASFVQLRINNNWSEDKIYSDLLNGADDPIMLSLEGAIHAKQNNDGKFLFVHYDEIVFDTKKTLNRIYDFCEWPKYEHQLENIKRPFVQNDEVYKLNGLHDVRRTVEKQKYHIDLPKDIMKKCRYLNSLIFED